MSLSATVVLATHIVRGHRSSHDMCLAALKKRIWTYRLRSFRHFFLDVRIVECGGNMLSSSQYRLPIGTSKYRLSVGQRRHILDIAISHRAFCARLYRQWITFEAVLDEMQPIRDMQLDSGAALAKQAAWWQANGRISPFLDLAAEQRNSIYQYIV